jgi:hypothetical protein
MNQLNINAILRRFSEPEELSCNEPQRAVMNVATCVGCGCTDDRACIDEQGDACHWLKVNRMAGLGVCSRCREFLNHPCTEDFD